MGALLDKFVRLVSKDNPQMGLVTFMNKAINAFASENPIRVSAIKTTQTMLFIVIQLFSNLYSHANQRKMKRPHFTPCILPESQWTSLS